LAGTDSDVVALYQGLQPGNTRQRNRRPDDSEVGALDQVILDPRIEHQLNMSAFQVAVDLEVLHLTRINTLVHHRCTARLLPLVVLVLWRYAYPGLGGVVIFIDT